MNKSRTTIRDVVARIIPLDRREREDKTDVLDWIDDGSEVYRRQKPDVPAKHLVSYVVVVDARRKAVLLMDHIKAGLWLPVGGHVWPGEDPHDCAVRELGEEIGYGAAQMMAVADLPLFVTATQTRGTGQHTDVSLWYVAAGDMGMDLAPDPGEFRGYRWFGFEEINQTWPGEFDPEMGRFLRKLRRQLD